MACEVETLFRKIGVQVTLLRGSSEGATADPEVVHVIPMSRPRPVWRLNENVMAAAPREEGVPQRIYLFLSHVQRVLGHGGKADASALLRQNLEFSRALGRVLAHEIVHAVVPAHPHAATGLMSARQRRGSLLRHKARLDPDCVKALLEALAST